MSVAPTSVNSDPCPPESPSDHPLLVVVLAISLATAAGVLVGWEAAVGVLIAVLGLFTAYRNAKSE